ncbi:MAG: RNA chaperone ProQ [Legionellaceae bacterium]
MTNDKPQRPTPPEVEIMDWLKTIFPKCFIKGEGKKPLKVGIHEDVLAYCLEHYPTVSRYLLSKAIKMYATGYAYISSIKVGIPRVDLEGNSSGTVTEKEAKHAESVLNEREAKRKAKLIENK